MKRLFIIVGLLACSWIMALAQSKCSSEPQSFHITRDGLPPVLDIVSGSVHFTDNDRNNVINAGEECAISLIVNNSGEGDASGCIARVLATGATKGLTYNDVPLPVIAHGQQHTLVVPVKASQDIETGEVHLSIEINEPHGLGIEPLGIDIHTQAFLAPCVEVVSHQVLTENQTELTKKKPFTLRVVVQNTQQGTAEQVKIDIQEPKNILLTSGNAHKTLPSLRPNESITIDYDLISTVNADDDILFDIALSEKFGKYAHNKQIDLHFGQSTGTQTNYVIHGDLHQNVDIKRVSLISDVDENIPVTNAINPNTFVLIIANEHYQQVAAVPYALNDGNIFKEYCIKTLGVSEKHIHYIPDATINHIKAQVNWLSNITETWDDPQVIVYYAGHGIPDEASKTAYLLPVDGSGTDVSTGYKLDELYSTLGKMPASRITVFMDACFSGSKREDGMLASARGVALKAKSGVPQGNMVVFSAAQGDETAFPYREQQHGMFTYHLLKKLQETSGDVTLQELGNYIIREVKKRSLEENDKKQTPTVTASYNLGSDWQNWTLK